MPATITGMGMCPGCGRLGPAADLDRGHVLECADWLALDYTSQVSAAQCYAEVGDGQQLDEDSGAVIAEPGGAGREVRGSNSMTTVDTAEQKATANGQAPGAELEPDTAKQGTIVAGTYATLEKQITEGETGAIMARWEFGRLLLAERKGKGKQLPDGRLNEVCLEVKRSRSEIKYRMQFALAYPTQAKVATAVATCGSWTAIRETLAQISQAAKPKKIKKPAAQPAVTGSPEGNGKPPEPAPAPDAAAPAVASPPPAEPAGAEVLAAYFVAAADKFCAGVDRLLPMLPPFAELSPDDQQRLTEAHARLSAALGKLAAAWELDDLIPGQPRLSPGR